MGDEIMLIGLAAAGLGALVYLMYRDATMPNYAKECIEEKKQWKKGAK